MTQYVQEKVERLEQPVTAWALLGLIALIVIAYAAFIDATITNIVSAKSMQTEISSLTTTMSDLESHYLSARSAISLDVALAQGYAQDDNPTFIMRTSANSLSFNQ